LVQPVRIVATDTFGGGGRTPEGMVGTMSRTELLMDLHKVVISSHNVSTFSSVFQIASTSARYSSMVTSIFKH
jgi:hypothetical protein